MTAVYVTSINFLLLKASGASQLMSLVAANTMTISPKLPPVCPSILQQCTIEKGPLFPHSSNFVSQEVQELSFVDEMFNAVQQDEQNWQELQQIINLD